MADLEDKIKLEQEARERLAVEYERALNQGVSQLNQETEILSGDSPLVDQISLIVAQELLRNANGNEPLSQLIRQSSVNGEVL